MHLTASPASASARHALAHAVHTCSHSTHAWMHSTSAGASTSRVASMDGRPHLPNQWRSVLCVVAIVTPEGS